ncbi:MAG: CHRD domain-containing protein, partial [Vicinamibacterales bacterium]
MAQRVVRMLAAFGLLAMLAANIVAVRAYHDGNQHPWADDDFESTWARTDLLVANGTVQRTWMWGPSPYTAGMMEPYSDSPGGMRLVQYTDKSRMEINDPDAFNDGIWYVTNGLLVIEMVEGHYQTGDADFDEAPAPAAVNITGDPGDESGPSPTYADIGRYGLRDAAARVEGTVITQRIDGEGVISDDPTKAGENVTAAARVTVDGIDHTVASVFWTFMTSTGQVWENGAVVTEPLFENTFYATGYPITEAYWSQVMVGGSPRDVLWQCFERRCLTYTPGNPAGFLVEAGNVGQHYHRWRYGDDGGPVDVEDQAFYAELTTDQEAPAPTVPSDASGDAVVFVNGSGNLSYEIIVVDIEGVTAAHIHLGMPGEAGPVVVTLFTGAFSTEDDGTGTLVTGEITADDLSGELEGMTLGHLLAEMEAGNTYVNVHT